MACAAVGKPKEMKLADDLDFHEDIRLLIWRPHGSLNEGSVNKVLAALGDLEASTQEPFHRFSDTTLVHPVELNFRYVINISLYRRFSYANHPIKSAILATDATAIHYGRLHALLTQGSAINVRVFHDRNEVASWLGVPPERLTSEADGDK
jgi:hypothetical protein